MYTVEEFDKEKTRVLKYIIYKKRSEQEIKNKFASTINEDMLEDIIEYLKEAIYINDNEYIEKAIKNFMVLKNLSLKEIRYKLMAKGLSKDDIEDYMYENDEELKQYETKSATNIAIKKQYAMSEEEIKQYLLKKGYNREAIDNAIEAIS
jgi:regulatory protein